MVATEENLLPAHAGPEEVCDFFGLDKLACARLRAYVDALTKWNPHVNLVASSTVPQVWVRHVADGLQLLPLLKENDLRKVIDLGSGGGVPGLVLALAEPALDVHLVESTARKCAFLRQVAQTCGIDVNIHQARIESLDTAIVTADVHTAISARALAPLPKLLALAWPWLQNGAWGLFLKGRGMVAELEQAKREKWQFDSQAIPSVTDAEGSILMVKEVHRD